MAGRKNKLLHLFIPDHISNPVSLTKRLLLSRNSSARFALIITMLGVISSPIDWVISKFQKPHKPSPVNPSGPHIFICGPARSGTTFLYQVLARHLNISHTRNLCMLLPRSSCTSIRICAWLFSKSTKRTDNNYENYYGKTRGFSAPSEANFLWNQWVDKDKSRFRTVLNDSGAAKMSDYYRFLSQKSKLPTLAKNNNANVFADGIADALPNSYFICLRRDTVFLAQSLIKARVEINGDLNQSYGVVDTTDDSASTDPYHSVLDQIDYLNKTALQQQSSVGADNFWIIDYENFCSNPTELINRIRVEILNQTPLEKTIPEFANANKVANEEVYSRVTEELKTREVRKVASL